MNAQGVHAPAVRRLAAALSVRSYSLTNRAAEGRASEGFLEVFA